MNIHTLADVRTYSVQYSDKVRFPQLRIKCDVAKSCLGTPHSSYDYMPSIT